MLGIRKAEFVEAVASKKASRARGRAAFGDLIEHGLALLEGAGLRASLSLVEGFGQLPTTYVFRRQMFSAMRSALRMTVEGECADLSNAVWQVQNRIRHAGRNIAYRSVGSTLLVKGLQFANAVVVHSESMNRNDWYVALTRATHTLTVLSPLRRFCAARIVPSTAEVEGRMFTPAYTQAPLPLVKWRPAMDESENYILPGAL